MSALLRFGESVFPYLLDTLCQATVLMVILLAVTRVLGRRRLAARYWLWVYCLVGILLLPVASRLAGDSRVALVRAKEVQGSHVHSESRQPESATIGYVRPAELPHQMAPSEAAATPLPAQTPTAESPTIGVALSDGTGDISKGLSPVKTRSVPAEMRTASGTTFPWRGWISLAWLLGCAPSLLRLLLAAMSVARIRGTSPRPSDSALLELLEKARKTAGVRKRVRLRVGKRPVSPVSIGIFRPTIFLPETLVRDLPAEHLYPILLHELAHIRSMDYAVTILERVVGSLYFFHPLVWMMSRELHSLREEICDGKVLGCYSDAVLYAKVLTEVAGRNLRPKFSPFASLCFLNHRAVIERRVERILDTEKRKMKAFGLKTALILFSISLTMVCSLSLLSLSARAVEEKEEAGVEHTRPAEGLALKILGQPQQVSDIPEYVGPARTEPTGEARYVVRPNAFRDGEPIYTDRTYALVGVPEKYQGLTYIQTANNDKMIQEKFQLGFEVNAPVMVYVGRDNRLEAKPIWLKAFGDTGDDVSSDDEYEPVFSLYARPYPKGKVILGPNGGVLMSSMYFVVVEELRPPYPKPIVMASSDTVEGEAPLQVRFHGAVLPSETPGRSYRWDFGDGTEKSDEQNPVHTYSTAGSYLATLTVTDSTGEVGSATVGIRVRPQAKIEEPTTAVIPAEAEEGIALINLDPHVNTPLKGWHGVEGNDIALEPGVQRLGDSSFRIGAGAIELAGTIYADVLPKEVEGIEIGLRFKKLHILHATGWGAGDEPYRVSDGTHIGSYLLHYEDGSTVEIPIKYGVHVRDWWAREDDPSEVSEGKVAWTGKAEYPYQHEGATTRLYSMAWENPHPDKVVATIDFTSTGTICAPFVIAMTAEGATAAAAPATEGEVEGSINLEPYFNAPMTTFHRRPGNDLTIPKGKQHLAGVDFLISNGIVYAAGNDTEDEGRSRKVEGIKVGLKFTKLHFLHAACWSEPDGTQIGSYVIHYEDGSKVEIPVAYGVHMRDWWANPQRRTDVSEGQIAWRGTNPYAMGNFGIPICLYTMAWDNPHPDNLVTIIDLLSSNTECSPWVVAMTADTEGRIAPAEEAASSEITIERREEKAPAEVIIDVTTDGRFLIGGVEKTVDELNELLQRIAESGDSHIIIRGDQKASWREIVKVLDACKKADLRNVSFAIAAPETAEEAKALPEIMINVTKSGKFVVAGVQRSIQEMDDMLEEMVKRDPDTHVVVTGDRGAPYSSIVNVLNLCRTDNISNLSLVVAAEGEQDLRGGLLPVPVRLGPSVPKAAKGPFVYVEGQVNSPGRYSFSPETKMTVYRAIILAGGFSRLANKTKVTLLTTDDEGKPRHVQVNVEDIIKGKEEFDLPVKPNDRIVVPERFW